MQTICEDIRKEELESLLTCEITEAQFEEALEYARRKQEYIFKKDRKKEVLQHWYLVKLTEEYVRILAFSKFTMDVCQRLRDIEKERPKKNRNALHTSIL